jgi:histidine triad (HIT) family protein
MTYDDDNVFAKILRGELPCHKIYEDDETFSFLDIMPRANGHALVIPKAPSMNIFDVDAETLCTTIKTVQRLAPVIRDAMKADGLLIQQFNEEAAGQTVFHVHFHIIPRWADVALKPHAGDMGDSETLAANSEKIIAAIETA